MSDTMTTESVQAIVTVDAGFICSACLAQHDMTELVTHDDDIFCQDCFDKCYYECSDCGDVDRLPAYQTVDYDDYCQNCYGERFTTCERCNDTCERCDDTCERDSITTVRTGTCYVEDWCEQCTSDNASRCESCGDYVHDDDTIETNHGSLCMSCYEDGYFTCEGCEKVCSNDDYARDGYCEDCWRERGLGKIRHLVDRLDDPAIRAIRVSRDDSFDAGNCTAGTDGFIDEFFPHLYCWASVTIGQIVDAVCPEGIENLASSDMEYAKQVGLACLHAVRRSGRNI